MQLVIYEAVIRTLEGLSQLLAWAKMGSLMEWLQ